MIQSYYLNIEDGWYYKIYFLTKKILRDRLLAKYDRINVGYNQN